MKLFGATLITCFLMYQSAFAQGLANISYGTDSTLEVITWNIERFPKRGSNTVDSVGKIIEALDADLIAFQEINDTGAFRQMINAVSGYDMVMSSGWVGGLVYAYKTSTISVQAIFKIYDSSTYRNALPRSPQVLLFSFDGEDYVAINNHLKCCGNGLLDIGNTSDEEFRRYQANSLLRQYINYSLSTAQVILLGDLNDVLTDPSQHNVFQMFLNDSADFQFADMNIALGPSSGWSYPNWPSHIDHIMVTNELFADLADSGSSVETIQIDNYMVGGFNNYDYYISDHLPVAMKLVTHTSGIGNTENHLHQIKLYPNPCHGLIALDLRMIEEAIFLTVSDLMGKTVYENTYRSGKIHQLEIDCPRGIYIVKIMIGDQIKLIKLLKL